MPASFANADCNSITDYSLHKAQPHVHRHEPHRTRSNRRIFAGRAFVRVAYRFDSNRQGDFERKSNFASPRLDPRDRTTSPEYSPESIKGNDRRHQQAAKDRRATAGRPPPGRTGLDRHARDEKGPHPPLRRLLPDHCARCTPNRCNKSTGWVNISDATTDRLQLASVGLVPARATTDRLQFASVGLVPARATTDRLQFASVGLVPARASTDRLQ